MTKSSKYGTAFSEEVYDYLKRNKVIGRNHYGYCGVGFVKQEGRILYTHFDEWSSYLQGNEYLPGGEYLGIISHFESREEFVSWLSDQSDESLSGKETKDDWYINNQRVTKAWLVSLLETEHSLKA